MHAGLLTTPVALGQLVASNRSASLVGRFGAKAVAAGGLVVVTGALIGYHSLTMTTPIAALECIFFLQGAGMGIVMPTATESVMSVVPRERGGAGSAITNTSRQVAVALGVAVLGSILAQAYRAGLAPGLGAVPAASRPAATQSIAATQAAAGHLGPGGHGPAGTRRSLVRPRDARDDRCVRRDRGNRSDTDRHLDARPAAAAERRAAATDQLAGARAGRRPDGGLISAMTSVHAHAGPGAPRGTAPQRAGRPRDHRGGARRVRRVRPGRPVHREGGG